MIRLINGSRRAAENPDSFAVPTDAQKQRLKPGSLVKIGLEDPDAKDQPSGERFWVEVETVDERELTGKLSADLLLFNLQKGSSINFRLDHVLAIHKY